MSKKVIVELRDDGQMYDADGIFLLSPISSTKYFDSVDSDSKTTLDLVKLGVTVDEIIKLKNMELI